MSPKQKSISSSDNNFRISITNKEIYDSIQELHQKIEIHGEKIRFNTSAVRGLIGGTSTIAISLFIFIITRSGG